MTTNHLNQAAWPFPGNRKEATNHEVGDREEALKDIIVERNSQLMRWTLSHDDEYQDRDWQVLIGRILLSDLEGADFRETLVKVAATALAAMEADSRFRRGLRAPGPEDC